MSPLILVPNVVVVITPLVVVVSPLVLRAAGTNVIVVANSFVGIKNAAVRASEGDWEYDLL